MRGGHSSHLPGFICGVLEAFLWQGMAFESFTSFGALLHKTRLTIAPTSQRSREAQTVACERRANITELTSSKAKQDHGSGWKIPKGRLREGRAATGCFLQLGEHVLPRSMGLLGLCSSTGSLKSYSRGQQGRGRAAERCSLFLLTTARYYTRAVGPQFPWEGLWEPTLRPATVTVIRVRGNSWEKFIYLFFLFLRRQEWFAYKKCSSLKESKDGFLTMFRPDPAFGLLALQLTLPPVGCYLPQSPGPPQEMQTNFNIGPSKNRAASTGCWEEKK